MRSARTMLATRAAIAALLLSVSAPGWADNFRKKTLTKTADRQSCIDITHKTLKRYANGPWKSVDIQVKSNAVYAYDAGVPGDDLSDLVIYCLIYDGKSHPVLVGHTKADGKWLKEHIDSFSYEFNKLAKSVPK